METEKRPYMAERWRASLETDLEEFARKENLIPWTQGNGILNVVGGLLSSLHYLGKAKTLQELLSTPKAQILEHGRDYLRFYGNRRRAEDTWRVLNNVLRRHGYRMYTKPRNIYGQATVSPEYSPA